MGKTTVGRRLAERLEVPFHDVDRTVEESAGESVAEIWENSGERRFREMERTAVQDLDGADPGVVALGAGALSTADVFAVLSKQAQVVELWADVSELVDRLGDVSTRPLLAADGSQLVGKLEEMERTRSPLYNSVATIRVDTTARSPEEVCIQILEELGL